MDLHCVRAHLFQKVTNRLHIVGGARYYRVPAVCGHFAIGFAIAEAMQKIFEFE